MQAVVDASARRYTFIVRLLSAFAALGAVLAAIGVYSVIAYLVARRRVELGVRLALGAQSGDVVALVMREGLLLTIIGVLGGTAAALATTQLLKAFLFEVTPHDAPTFLIAAFAFAIVSVMAALVPARRAAAISPAIALRD
jgi:ABC-type antimicrobial peptide transport system permease subunit